MLVDMVVSKRCEFGESQIVTGTLTVGADYIYLAGIMVKADVASVVLPRVGTDLLSRRVIIAPAKLSLESVVIDYYTVWLI